MNSPDASARRPKAYMSPITTNLIHLRNPVTIALWSTIFPGFGQIALGQYIKGYILILWEILVNTQSHLNLVILYTFTGRFQEAAAVANPRWLLLYNAVYVFALWDSYRTAVDLNKLALLADRSDEVMTPVRMNGFTINYLDKRIPWVAAAWSALMPGLGHLYVQRLPCGFFLLLWWVATAYFSRLMEVLTYTLLGDFAQAVAVADWQWLLFMPSIHWFAIYDSYVNTVEHNKLFAREQAAYLRREYFDSSGLAALVVEGD